MIRVLHLNPTKTWRGGEQQTLYLAQFLNKQKEVQQYVCCYPNSILQERCQKENISVYPLRVFGEWDIFAAKRLSEFIIKNHIDILHAHTARAHSIALLSKSFALKKKYSFKLLISRRVDFSIRKSKWEFINKITTRKYYSDLIDSYIAISQKVKEILISDGISESKIHVVYSGIDLNRFKNKPNKEKIEQLKKSIGITNELILGNVAALVDHKDHKTLLLAMSLLKKETLPPYMLLIIGDGELKSLLLRLKGELQLDNVLFLGYRDDVFDFYHLFDIFVMSSKEEGLGTSLLDAMAMGLPIVATSGGGIPEIVVHEKGGLLSQPQNPEALAFHIKKMILEPQSRKKFSKFNQKHVQQFHYENTGKETLNLYKKVLTKE